MPKTRKICSLIKKNYLFVIILVLGIAAHGVNLFGFPAYREDEGTYMSQAWSVIHLNSLAPYTYWYDHAPAGWLFISVWDVITANQFFAGMAANSGRIFIVVLSTISAMLVYKITKSMTGRKDAALIAMFLFSLVPLGIIFQRRVYLDNIMVFWLLLSIYFICKKPTLSNAFWSALCIAISALSKESAVAFIPGIAILAYWRSSKSNRNFLMTLWFLVTFLTGSIYVVFALLKGELFPTGTLLGGTNPHVSLWDALVFQLNRGDSPVPFFSATSPFMSALNNSWIIFGASFLILGLLATLIGLFFFKNRWLPSVSALSIGYILFTIRGQILDWYILPLIPLFAISIASFYAHILNNLPPWKKTFKIFRWSSVSIILGTTIFQLFSNSFIFTLDQTGNQVAAVNWVKENLSGKGVVMTDNYPFVDLNPRLTDVTKTDFQYYWKADTDPVIRYGLLNNDWQNIDYLLFTPAMAVSIKSDGLNLIQTAYQKSFIIKRFDANNILGQGYPVEIRATNGNNGPVIKSWNWYKENYISKSGQVIDASQGSNKPNTTSEAQSYALLRAVWANDRPTFDLVRNWTNANLLIQNKNIFSWHYGVRSDGSMGIIDSNPASDADEDIALAMLFAYKRWGGQYFHDQAIKIINDIWKYGVVKIGSTYYLTSGFTSKDSSGHIINPSYFSPAAYRIFAQATGDQKWNQLASDVYKIINNLKNNPKFINSTGLPPNWFIVDDSENYSLASAVLSNNTADMYGYDAFRLMWRIALDNLWFQNNDANDYLRSVSSFFEQQWRQNKRFFATYDLGGRPTSQYSDLSTNVGALSVLQSTDPNMAIDVFTSTFWPSYNNGIWGDPENYYNQNWAWFGTALYGSNLENLWVP